MSFHLPDIAVPDSPRCASLAAFMAESASLAPLLMLQTLQRIELAPPEGWQIIPRCQQLRIAPCFHPLVTRWHDALLEEGMLECDGADWSLAECAPGEMLLAQRIDDGCHRLRQLMGWLDDPLPLAAALFSERERVDDWLRAPERATEETGLHQLHLHSGVIAHYFSAVASQLAAVHNADMPIASGLLAQPDAHHTLLQLRQRSADGNLHLLLEQTCEHPLHCITPAAVHACAQANALADCPTELCQQRLKQADFELLQSWPPVTSALACHGQRLLLTRCNPSRTAQSGYTES